MSRYPIRNRNWRDDTATWPHSEMWRQWLSEVEADRLAQRKTREEKQKWNSDNAATPPR